MTRGSALALGVVCAALMAGCAKAQAKSAPDGPALQIPQPPPREIMAASEPPPLPIEEPEVPPASQPAPPVVVPRPAPVPRAARPMEPPAPSRVETRTLRAPGDLAREQAILDLLTGASSDLTRVDYGRLSVGARGQYDQAKRFIQQAEQAIKDQNLAFASTLADKAATLAADLAGR